MSEKKQEFHGSDLEKVEAYYGIKKEDIIEDDKVAKQLEIELLSKLPFFKRHIFSWIIKMARKTVRERENLRFERTRLFGRVRKIFLAMGQKMVEENIKLYRRMLKLNTENL